MRSVRSRRASSPNAPCHRFDKTLRFNQGTPVPTYGTTDEVGLDAVLALDSLSLKFEVIWRRSEMDEYMATVVGSEDSLPEISGVSVGLIAEYLYDGRSQNTFVSTPTPFQNDIRNTLPSSVGQCTKS